MNIRVNLLGLGLILMFALILGSILSISLVREGQAGPTTMEVAEPAS